MADLLADDISMDTVTLHVDELTGMVTFYRDALGLTVIDDAKGVVRLGRGNTPLVALQHTPGLPLPARGQAGLFHTALLFPDDAGVASTLASVATVAPHSFTGSADHLVSQAFYLSDPEGNGIELYADRPREQWRWTDGRVEMATLPLDPNGYLRQHLTEVGPATPGSAEPAVVGHVHLQVGSTDDARAFYVDTLGFEVTAQMPGALFVSVGGYHHNMAMNSWGTRGAGPRASSLGLGEVSIVVPGPEDRAALAERLRHHRIAVQDDGARLAFDDPWSNRIIVAEASTVEHARPMAEASAVQ